MTNIRLSSIDDYLDVASVNAYHTFFTKEPEEKRMRRIWRSSRDSARTPVQWTGGENAGFSAHTPWFFVNPNYRKINAEAEEADPDSILHFYRKCLRLRKELPVLIRGSYREYAPRSRKLFLYERAYRGERILVICSSHKRPVRLRLPKDYARSGAEILLTNYPGPAPERTLRPYEARILKLSGT